ETHLVVRIDLDLGRSHLGVIEGADGEFEAEAGLVGERSAAIGAEAAAGAVGALEPLRRAAGPGCVAGGDQRHEEPAEGLLAHSAVADRAAPQQPDAEAHRAALAPAG